VAVLIWHPTLFSPSRSTLYVACHTVAKPTKLAGKKMVFKIFHLAERNFILLEDD
jgi:hypothetical protein